MMRSPALPAASARSASKIALPTAAPGEALTPRGQLEPGIFGPRDVRVVEAWQQQLHHLRRLDALERLVLADQPLADHVHGDLDRRAGAVRFAERVCSM